MGSVTWDWFLAKPVYDAGGAFTEFNLLGELASAQRRHLDVALNSVESASFSINTLDEVAQKINPVDTCVVAYRNGLLRWSGPVWTVNETVADGQETVEVTCVGWLQLLLSRILKCGEVGFVKEAGVTKGAMGSNAVGVSTSSTITYNEQGPEKIAEDLLLRANFDLPTGISVGTIEPNAKGLKWTITYQRWQNIGHALQQLANTESGFDFRIQPDTLALNIYYHDVRGFISGRGRDRPSVVFGYGTGPSNLASLTRTIDGASLMNRIIIEGQFGLFGSHSSPSIQRYGMWESEESITGISFNELALLAVAEAEVHVRENPLPILTFNPMTFSKSDSNVPQPFDDYDIGDFVRLVADYGRMKIPESVEGEPLPVRVYAMAIDIDNEGNEKVSNVQTIYTSAS